MKYLLPLIILAGCTTVPTQRVEVPIPITCKTPTPPAPDFCMPTLNKNEDIFTKTKCALSDLELHLGYELSLIAALESCK